MKLGTPLAANATRAMLLGAGELGKEVAIELQRLGVETIALDRYPNAPAMQVAHRGRVLDMRDGAALRAAVEAERPDLIIPEIEAIATQTLLDLEAEGWRVVPTARAVNLTMNREGIRRLASETLRLPTSKYRFATNDVEYRLAVDVIGLPCVVKPVMSSSGKGQSTVRRVKDLEDAWQAARAGARGSSGTVIVEELVNFDYEITLLVVRHVEGLVCCPPIGHKQVDGDYRESWQPARMSDRALRECQSIAIAVVQELGGCGLFGVEFFVADDQVWFSEVSPRPHDTGMVTLISQSFSEFALHVRAILGLPVTGPRLLGPAASAVILATGDSDQVAYDGMAKGLAGADTDLRLFGKPEVRGERRMGVALALADTVEAARRKARAVANSVQVQT